MHVATTRRLPEAAAGISMQHVPQPIGAGNYVLESGLKNPSHGACSEKKSAVQEKVTALAERVKRHGLRVVCTPKSRKVSPAVE